MKRSRWKALSGFVMAASMAAFLCALPGAAQTAANAGTNYPPQPNTANFAQPPQPGAVNYVEGQAFIGSQVVAPKAVGSTALAAGKTLTTQAGRAEMLLTPGIFFRISNNSAVQMVSPGLENTVVTLQRGRALVEVDNILPENNVVVNSNGSSTRLLQPGLYDFDADHGAVRIFDGKASVESNGRNVDVKGDHEVLFSANNTLKTHKFDAKQYQDDFYRWASLRSSYLTEANVDAARRYAGGTGYAPGLWAGANWYWDPWFSAYTFIPGDGIFYSPFGWGFYSPWYAYGAPFLGYGFFGGYHHFGPGYRPSFVAGGTFGAGSVAAHARSFNAHGFNGGAGFRSGGFGAAGGMRAGGFGGGGFHGGGGGHR